jgi:hypothetical protein
MLLMMMQLQEFLGKQVLNPQGLKQEKGHLN